MNRDFLPYYMMYPFPFWEERDAHITRDLEYLQQMYPKKAKQYQKLVYETLNLLDYEGSVIYDEYPDRLGLRLIVNAIYEKYEKQQSDEDMFTDKQLIKEMIEILLYQEILKRRQLVKRFYLWFL